MMQWGIVERHPCTINSSDDCTGQMERDVQVHVAEFHICADCASSKSSTQKHWGKLHVRPHLPPTGPFTHYMYGGRSSRSLKQNVAVLARAHVPLEGVSAADHSPITPSTACSSRWNTPRRRALPLSAAAPAAPAGAPSQIPHPRPAASPSRSS